MLKVELEIQNWMSKVSRRRLNSNRKISLSLQICLCKKKTELELLSANVSDNIQVHNSLMSRANEIGDNLSRMEFIYNSKLKSHYQGVPLDYDSPKFQCVSELTINKELISLQK